MKHKITAEDLEMNPELKEHCKEGDIVELGPITAKITPEYYEEDSTNPPDPKDKPPKP